MSRIEPAFDLQFERRQNYLFARLAGEMTSSTALQSLAQIMLRAADVHSKSVIVDCDLIELLDDNCMQRAIMELAKMHSGTKAAFIRRHSPDRDGSPAPGIGLFHDVGSAERWLADQ
jgi:hypothetical protein